MPKDLARLGRLLFRRSRSPATPAESAAE